MSRPTKKPKLDSVTDDERSCPPTPVQTPVPERKQRFPGLSQDDEYDVYTALRDFSAVKPHSDANLEILNCLDFKPTEGVCSVHDCVKMMLSYWVDEDEDPDHPSREFLLKDVHAMIVEVARRLKVHEAAAAPPFSLPDPGHLVVIPTDGAFWTVKIGSNWLDQLQGLVRCDQDQGFFEYLNYRVGDKFQVIVNEEAANPDRRSICKNQAAVKLIPELLGHSAPFGTVVVRCAADD